MSFSHYNPITGILDRIEFILPVIWEWVHHQAGGEGCRASAIDSPCKAGIEVVLVYLSLSSISPVQLVVDPVYCYVNCKVINMAGV